MQIDITKLLINAVSNIKIKDSVLIPDAYLTKTLISSLDNVMFDGTISLDEENNVEVSGKVFGTMLLKDDITLAPVEYKFEEPLDESIATSEFKLDITDILWQNIVTSIPSKVRATEEEVKLEGDGWRVISEDEYYREKKSSQNPFADLAELLKKEEK